MPGLVPGIHVFLGVSGGKDVDGRDKPGHDERLSASPLLRYDHLIFAGYLCCGFGTCALRLRRECWCTNQVKLRESSSMSAQPSSARPAETYDVVVVGAGFGGMYMLHRLRALGFSV